MLHPARVVSLENVCMYVYFFNKYWGSTSITHKPHQPGFMHFQWKLLYENWCDRVEVLYHRFGGGNMRAKHWPVHFLSLLSQHILKTSLKKTFFLTMTKGWKQKKMNDFKEIFLFILSFFSNTLSLSLYIYCSISLPLKYIYFTVFSTKE